MLRAGDSRLGQRASGMFELTVDLQLDAAHGEQQKPRLGPSRSHEVADTELPFPDARRLRPGQRIFYALVIHGHSRMPPAPMQMEPKSSLCPTVARFRSVRNPVPKDDA